MMIAARHGAHHPRSNARRLLNARQIHENTTFSTYPPGKVRCAVTSACDLLLLLLLPLMPLLPLLLLLGHTSAGPPPTSPPPPRMLPVRTEPPVLLSYRAVLWCGCGRRIPPGRRQAGADPLLLVRTLHAPHDDPPPPPTTTPTNLITVETDGQRVCVCVSLSVI